MNWVEQKMWNPEENIGDIEIEPHKCGEQQRSGQSDVFGCLGLGHCHRLPIGGDLSSQPSPFL